MGVRAPLFGRLRLALAVGLLLFACAGNSAPQAPTPLLLATTTSLADSGLLDALLGALREERPNYAVKPLVVGSGQSLALAARGEVDVLITHDPQNEDAFLAAHPKAKRWPFMNGHFVVAGPAKDPARVGQAKDVAEAFARIAQAQAPFISRGDNSGTHNAERRVWRALGVTPQAPWYAEAGGGMAAALRLASERGAYLLTDVATFAQVRDKLALKILTQGPGLPNPYSLVLVDSQAGQTPRAQAALAFLRFLSSPKARAMIADFGRERLGQPLFTLPAPDAPKP